MIDVTWIVKVPGRSAVSNLLKPEPNNPGSSISVRILRGLRGVCSVQSCDCKPNISFGGLDRDQDNRPLSARAWVSVLDCNGRCPGGACPIDHVVPKGHAGLCAPVGCTRYGCSIQRDRHGADVAGPGIAAAHPGNLQRDQGVGQGSHRRARHVARRVTRDLSRRSRRGVSDTRAR